MKAIYLVRNGDAAGASDERGAPDPSKIVFTW